MNATAKKSSSSTKQHGKAGDQPSLRLPGRERSGSTAFIQPKLTINTPGDRYEQEADSMAEKVVRMPFESNETKPTQGVIASAVRRNPKSLLNEGMPLMRNVQGGGFLTSPSFAFSLHAKKGNGYPLSGPTKDFMDNAFSTDFSRVRIHSDRHAATLSKGIGARAFTHGEDIFFNEGQYNPSSREGKKLLAHELTHVVQQRSSMAGPMIQRRLLPGQIPTVSVAASLGRTQELIERLNVQSGAIHYLIGSGGITYEVVDEPAMTDFDWQLRRLIDNNTLTLIRLIQAFRLVENALGLELEGSSEGSQVNIDNLLAANDVTFQLLFLRVFGESISVQEEGTDHSDTAATPAELAPVSDGTEINSTEQEPLFDIEPAESTAVDGTKPETEASVIPPATVSDQESGALSGASQPYLDPEPLMPEAPTELNPEARERMEQVQSRAGRAARVSADMPSDSEITMEAREGVTEPAEETQAVASAELTEQLSQRPEPSTAIEELCANIRRAIRERRPPDEDSLLQAEPESAANEVGTQLNDSISSDVDRVGEEYNELENPPAGERQQTGTPPELPPAQVDAPQLEAVQAAPDPLPAEEVSLDNDVQNTEAAMEHAGMTTDVANEIQDPNNPIVAARETQSELAQTAAEDPALVLARQDEAIANSQGRMEELQAQALQALQASRSNTLSGTGTQQTVLIGTEEQKRAEVGRRAEAIFTHAQTQVNNLLQPLTRTAMDMWRTGKERIAMEFRQHLDRVQRWVDERHSGVGGFFLGAADYFTGLPDWVTEEYNDAEYTFSEAICEKIREISTYVNGIILTCEEIISNADEQISQVFEDARGELGDWVDQEQGRFADRLNGLREQVHETRDNFDRDLANEAAQAVQEVREEVHALREAARGLIGSIANAIAAFIEDPIKFIIEGLLMLVGIPPVSFWALINRIQEVISDIAEDPVGFAGNLLAAVGRGFEQFFDNFGTHILEGLIEWLFSGLGAMGIQIPRELSLPNIVTFFLQLMGITWERIRRILARHIGEENVEMIEQAWEFISNLIEMGPTGIFEMIKEQLNPQTILDNIIRTAVDFLVETIVTQVAGRLLLMFNPAGAIAQAIEAIYRVLKWIFQNAARIFTFVETVVNGMADIISGNIGGMANAVEQALKRLLVPVIDFIAEFFRLGALPERVADTVQDMQVWVEGMLDRAIGWIANQTRALMQRLGFGGEEEEESSAELEDSEVGEVITFNAADERHRLWIDDRGGLTIMVASETTELENKVRGWVDMVHTVPEENQNEARSLLSSTSSQLNLTLSEAEEAKLAIQEAEANLTEENVENAENQDNEVESAERQLVGNLKRLFEIFGAPVGDVPEIGRHGSLSGTAVDGTPRESHHVPEAELAVQASNYYEQIANRLINLNRVSEEMAETMATVGESAEGRADRISSGFPGGRNLPAILIHVQTHRRSSEAIHRSLNSQQVINEIAEDIREHGGSDIIRVVMVTLGGQRKILGSIREQHWRSAIGTTYQIERQKEREIYQSDVGENISLGTNIYDIDVSERQDGSQVIRQISVRKAQGMQTFNRITAELEDDIETVFKSLGENLSDDWEAISQLADRFRRRIDNTALNSYNSALNNAMAQLSRSLSQSNLDGDSALHGAILNELRSFSRQIWEGEIVKTLEV